MRLWTTRERRENRERCRPCPTRPSAPTPCGRRRSRGRRARAWRPPPTTVQCSSDSGVEPAPHADEGVLLPLVADRGGVGVARVHVVSGGSSISTSMIECLRSSKLVEPGRAHAAHRALEERVAGEDVLVVHEERRASRPCARACAARRSAGRPTSSTSPGSIVRSTSMQALRLERVGQDLDAEPLLVDVVLRHVVVVVVGEQQVVDVSAVALERLEQRLGRPARVDRSPPCRPARRPRGRSSTASPGASSAR